MTPIRIRTTLTSDTPHLPELGPLVGHEVEIEVREVPATRQPGVPSPLPPPGAPVADVLAWIAANKIRTLAPGTPDSVDMIREDRER